jgi:outer membrane protein
MKKEFEKKYATTLNARKKIVDSLTFELNVLLKKIETEKEKNKSSIQEFNTKREEYIQRKKNYEEDNAALTKQYDQEILTQLTQYVKDYGEKNYYTYIFGNDGNGSLMYASETKNITKEVLEFINSKYKGVE